MDGFITLAAHDTEEDLKALADIVCSGKNDEISIQKAIDECALTGKNLYLFNGRYYIEGFYDFGDGGPKSALCFPNIKREIFVLGQNYAYSNRGGPEFYVPASAIDSVDEVGVDVIRTTWTNRGISNGSALRIECIKISLSHNQGAVRCIDLRRCDRPEIKNVKMCAYVDMNAGLGNPPPIPAVGCIGLTMTDGSNNSFSSYTNMTVSGFYEGYQVAGECVSMLNCGALMCYYGHTFGNYEINCGVNHPITIINGKDERNVNLPLFNRCGDGDGHGGRLQGNQAVTMIGFHMERIAEQTPGGVLGDLMREVHPGTWKGNIDFTLQPAWCHTNTTDAQLWENDGSGVGIKTRNNCHKTICDTKERLSYYPTYGQQIFDTDLNKMVICVDPANKKWVDFNGNPVG